MTGDSKTVVVRQIVELPSQLDLLSVEAEAEGFEMISVLQDEWRSGANRFERPGEILALATIDGEVAGIGGTTQDFMDSGWLRMRRFYVRPTCEIFRSPDRTLYRRPRGGSILANDWLCPDRAR